MIPSTVGHSAALPDLACDCHMHVFSDAYPIAATATLGSPPASLADYAVVQQTLGLQRHVLVQPSAYGTDNRLLMQTLSTTPSTARGVAVVDSAVSDAELAALDRAGVVGIRFNQVQQGATTMEMFDALAPHVNELGWHVQLHLMPSELIRQAPRLAAAKVPIVLDHYARLCASPELIDETWLTLIRLMATGNTWLKLSAPYLASRPDDPAFSQLFEFTQRLVRGHVDRLVWGSDWPHVTETSKPDDAQLLNRLQRLLAEDSAAERAIFCRNPAALYHFDE